jgi:hypothetical protein
MGIVSVDFSARKTAPVSRHQAFCLARQEMIRTLQAWIKDGADAEDLRDEIEGTHNAIRAIGILFEMDGP